MSDLLSNFFSLQQYKVTPNTAKKLCFKVIYHGLEITCQWLVVPFGPSPAPYAIQCLNSIPVDYFKLKYQKFASIYLDDYFYEPNNPSLVEIGQKLGMIFHDKKFAEGSIVQMLGVDLNLVEKTATVSASNIKKLTNIAKEAIFRGKISEKNLEKLMGCISFAAQFCSSGRLNTFFLTGMLANIQRETRELSSELDIDLDQCIIKELGFWSEFSSAECLSFKKRPEYTSNLDCFSDASKGLWAVKLGARTFSGEFPEEYKDSDIMTKEAYALKQAIEKLDISGHEITLYNDNQPLTYAFKHQYSRNPQVHKLLKQAYDIVLARDNSVKVQWVTTNTMAEAGADPESRGVYRQDLSALSDAGVARARDLMKLQDSERLFDLFSAPADNVFECFYFSLQTREEDPWNMEEDAWELLERLRLEGRKLEDVFWVFPPRNMAIKTASSLASLGLGTKARLFLLIDSDLVTQVVLKFRSEMELQIANFNSSRTKKLFRSRASKPRSLLKIVAKPASS